MSGRWVKGQSGNAAGRKPGTGKVAKLRESLGRGLPKIIAKLKAQALAGDVHAARLLLERAIPPLKTEEASSAFEMPEGTLTEQGQAVLAAVAAGALTAAQGAHLLAGLESMARIVQADDLAAKVEALQRAADLIDGKGSGE